MVDADSTLSDGFSRLALNKTPEPSTLQGQGRLEQFLPQGQPAAAQRLTGLQTIVEALKELIGEHLLKSSDNTMSKAQCAFIPCS